MIFISLSLAICIIFNLLLNIILAADSNYILDTSTHTVNSNSADKSVVYMINKITPESRKEL